MGSTEITRVGWQGGSWAMRRATLRIGLLLLLAVLVISAQYAPSVIHQRRDSGIFAYTGRVIVEGGLPYVDAWDNKLPGVFYIDAAAFWLFGVNRWALWIAEVAWVYLAALLTFWLLNRMHGRRALAWTGSLLLVVLVRHPALVSDTNFTEPFALLPQMLVWAAGYVFLQKPDARAAFVIGFAAGAALLIKQTTVGAACALIPAVWISRHPVWHAARRWRYLACMITGGVACLGLMALFLAGQGILDDALKASFLDAGSFHEWVGQGTPWIGATIWHSVTSPKFSLAYGPLLPFWLVGARRAIQGVKSAPHADRQAATHATIAIWAVGAFAINLALANVTDRSYAHYYVPLIPSVAVLVVLGLAAYEMRSGWAWRYLLALLVLIPVGSTLGRCWMAGWEVFGAARTRALATYVADHTEPGDRVWVWGANVVVNFQSGRDSPSQYTYGYPLIVPGETSERRIAEVVRDLNENPPAMIVDSAITDGDRVPPLDAARRAVWWEAGGRRDVANLEPIYQFVADHCALGDEIEGAGIYRCKG